MIKTAIVGYRGYPSGGDGDMILWFPKRISSLFPDINYCHIDIVEDRRKSIDAAVAELIALRPDVLHYANFRDTYTGFGFEREYISLVKELSDIPILLTTGHDRGEQIAAEFNVEFLRVPFMLETYAAKIRGLAGKR